ncbi:MAG: transporter ATP-binding protein [Thermoleophilia bacterium]|nr:transporter ATP-binding protein [Thermoleophilia bacterium]
MRRRLIYIVAAVVVVAALASFGWWRHAERAWDRTSAPVTGAGGVQLDAALWVPDRVDADDPAPAVLIAHGLGEDQDDVTPLARALVQAGYVVRTWTARGGPGSDGRVGIAAPDGEVADVAALIDELATRDDVRQDGDDDPRVAVIGTSHGGGTALLAAASDPRIDAVVPIFAWYDLADALEPAGVLKLRWGSELFAAGAGDRHRGDPCGNLVEAACAAWTETAQAGRLTPAARDLLDSRSVATAVERLHAPTLIVQGQMDSLFDLDQATRLAHALDAHRTPVRVEWVRGGHDLPLDRRKRDHVHAAVLRWLERYLDKRGGVEVGPRFSVELGAGRGFAHAPTIPPKHAWRNLDLRASDAEDATGFVRVTAPAAGLPASATTLPGLGDVTGLDSGFEPPEVQRARFRSDPVDTGVELIGSPRVRLQFSASRPEAIAFVRLVDVAPDGRRVIPRGLVSPVRLTGLPPLGSARGRGVDVELPPIAWRLAPGHRLDVEVASTDAGYVPPDGPMTIAVRPAGSSGLRIPEVREPQRTADTFEAGFDWRDLLLLAAAIILVALVVGVLAARGLTRRDTRVQEPGMRELPLRARGLVKRFGDGRVAVADVSFDVEPGAVVGLVGPNGAGKTTVLRMLLGLVHPSDGFAHVFGQRIRPGVPNLARIGALVEGPGLAPHMTGREHLERYWSATGRPLAEAHVDAALETVELQADADRVVRTWSHGMRQRLGIAQALLGTPDVVVLDEPANGLDPAQIAQLRELVRTIVASGRRSVLLSSHLLGELEQVCTHVVLLAEGRVLQAGTLAEVVGEHPDLETAFLSLVRADREATHA